MFSEWPQYPVYQNVNNKTRNDISIVSQVRGFENFQWQGHWVMREKKQYAVKIHSFFKWIFQTEEVLSCSCVSLVSRQSKCKLETKWTVWFQKPWADSWASVLACAWQGNAFVLLLLSVMVYEEPTVKYCSNQNPIKYAWAIKHYCNALMLHHWQQMSALIHLHYQLVTKVF